MLLLLSRGGGPDEATPCDGPRWAGPAEVRCGTRGEVGTLHGPMALLFGGRLDLNRADPTALEVLPGVGPSRAAAIVAFRRDRAFCTLEDLLRVPGIGPRTLARLAPQATVSSGGACPP